MPSTTTKIFFHGLWVRGCPQMTAFFNFASRLAMSLCLNVRMVAPVSLAPRMRDEWLSWSLMMRQPLDTKTAMFMELVANPIPNTIALSTPRYSATTLSSSTFSEEVPSSCRVDAHPTPHLRILCSSLNVELESVVAEWGVGCASTRQE